MHYLDFSFLRVGKNMAYAYKKWEFSRLGKNEHIQQMTNWGVSQLIWVLIFHTKPMFGLRIWLDINGVVCDRHL